MTKGNLRDRKLLQLLRDYRYDVQGNVIIHMDSRHVIQKCRSIFDAADSMCPIISDNEYTTRLISIQKGD
jgi:hypothetical protein